MRLLVEAHRFFDILLGRTLADAQNDKLVARGEQFLERPRWIWSRSYARRQ